MSQDLFAEFGSPPIPPGNSRSVFPGDKQSLEHISAQSSIPAQSGANALLAGGNNDDEDDFGDFEDASITALPRSDIALNSTSARKDNKSAIMSEIPETLPVARPSQSVRKIPFAQAPSRPSKQANGGAAVNAKTYPPPKPSQPVKKLPFSPRPKTPPNAGSHPFANHMDLLFDADEDEYNAGSDEMADLATNPEAAMAYSKRVIAAQQAQEASMNNKRSVPGAPAVEQNKESVRPAKSTSSPIRDEDVLFDVEEDMQDDFGDFEAANDSAHGGNNAPVAPAMPAVQNLALEDEPVKFTSPAKATVAQSTIPEDDAWDDFETAAAPNVALSTKKQTSDMSRSSPFQRATAAIAAKVPLSDDADRMPPTNIPPPAVLLSIFPSIFTSGQEALLDPLSKLDIKQRQGLLAHPATQLFLRGYLGYAIVLGHIIAGRKLRWKRDQYLAQGMRIGPAGGKNGMKLTGIDKSEIAKEDREVLDALRLWKMQVGKLKSAAASGSATTPDGEGKLPAVPEISERTMPVRTVTAAGGGITAPHACTLCGLKRDERVAKVDVEVHDSFGEWWVESMNMHLLCRNFWQEHKAKLKSR